MSNAPAVDYALRIIEFFSQSHTAVGIADISNALGINKNAVSRVLGALLESGWIYCFDPAQKKYAFTVKPFSIVSGSLERSNLQSLAQPYVNHLHEITGDCTYLGVRHNENVLYTLHHNSVGDVKINARVGGEYPLHCSAAGKALLAWSPSEEITAYFAQYATARTPQTITSLPDFLCETERIRKQGYALDLEEFGKGILCIAAPVFDAERKIVAAVGISTLTIYHTPQSLVEEKMAIVTETAANISAALGYTV